jgi:hypothetical protein
MQPVPTTTKLNWQNHYRIIPSVFPPINFFEGLVDTSQMEEAFYIEGLTNDRLREEVGDISLVPKEDRISGEGSSVVMAAFTHTGYPSRFTDGSFGVYYASNTLKTAIKETVYHREKFLSFTNEEPGQIDMRVYVGEILKPLHDLRHKDYVALHHPDNYRPSQIMGRFLKSLNAWGLVYNSVRDEEGECIGILRPPAISIPKQSKHLVYNWNGTQITDIFEKRVLSFT